MKNMKEKKRTGIPEFKTLEEEREYWEARGPLAEGHKGTINKPRAKQKRSSFLAVRLTGEELTKLRDIAAKQGVGPSTFARIVLTTMIQQGIAPTRVPLDDFINAVSGRFSKEDIEKCQNFIKDIVIGDPKNPALLVYSGESKKWEEFALLMLERLFGIKIVQTEDENLKKVKELVKE
ncbi:MAG: hypothetical protein A2Z15_04955 [Chloroflexi bacterium RBG_16_50_11]|nr:MAG: hypothetical protein A2Z15_04955 [Chloroflexi bacterium RBG_16_50_11]